MKTLLLLVAAAALAHARLHVWSPGSFMLKSSSEDDQPSENPAAMQWHVQVDFPVVATFFKRQQSSSNNARRLEEEEDLLSFDLPVFGTQHCNLVDSHVFALELQQRYPELVTKYGTCNQGQVDVVLNLHMGIATSLSATFTNTSSHSTSIYLDNANAEQYVLYTKHKPSVAEPEQEAFNCRTKHKNTLQSAAAKSNNKQPRRSFSGVTLRLAIATNREYSIFSGDTPSATLNSLAAVVSRANGIYMRELGVFFQLVANTDKLLCTLGKSMNCGMLPNTDGAKILDNAYTFFTSRGVPDMEYDIGHVLTTGNGGIANLAVACTAFKAQGTTGMRSPVGDAFSVDYFAHEIGHQLNGYHTFKDCGKAEDNDQAADETAVEPGSGSTIMGYAGVCNGTNLQPHSDPYFHSINLEMMENFLQQQLRADATCGLDRVVYVEEMLIGHAGKSTTSQVNDECKLPVGSYFMLTASANPLATAAKAVYYQWDEIDAGVQRFGNPKNARFRSWKPRRTGERYFPNLYYLTRGLQNQAPYSQYERLPLTPQTLHFRFTARTRFDSQANDMKRDNAMLGNFAFKDFAVHFVSTIHPLKFTPATRQRLKRGVKAGSVIQFTWNRKGGGASVKVEILVALNPMLTSSSAMQVFDSELDVQDLAWISLGTVANTGKTKLRLPYLGDGGNVRVSFMIRTNRPVASFCVAFDFVPSALLIVPMRVPTRVPTKPTNMPTVEPTLQYMAVTQRPTLSVAIELPGLSVAVKQDLHAKSCTVPSSQCNYQSTTLACKETTKVVKYTFTAPNSGMFQFSTVNPQATCLDTTLYALEADLCNDDAYYGEPRAQLTLALFKGDVATLFVGSYEDGCANDARQSIVSLQADMLSASMQTIQPTSFPTQQPTTPTVLVPLHVGLLPQRQTLFTCQVPSKWCNYNAYGSICKTSTKVVGYSFIAMEQGTYVFTPTSSSCKEITLYAMQFDLCTTTNSLTVQLLPAQQVDLYVGSVNDDCGPTAAVFLSVKKQQRRLR